MVVVEGAELCGLGCFGKVNYKLEYLLKGSWHCTDCQTSRLVVLNCTKWEQKQYCLMNLTNHCNRNTGFFFFFNKTTRNLFPIGCYSVTLVFTVHFWYIRNSFCCCSSAVKVQGCCCWVSLLPGGCCCTDGVDWVLLNWDGLGLCPVSPMHSTGCSWFLPGQDLWQPQQQQRQVLCPALRHLVVLIPIMLNKSVM